MNENEIKSILMIDDDMDDCILFRQALREILADVELVVSEGCKVSPQFLKTNIFPDLILLDLNMPGKNGLECMDVIKSTDKFSSVPIFIYSTSSDLAQVKLCYEKGAKLYIQKPSSYNKIKELVKTLVGFNFLTDLNNTSEYTILKF